MTRRYPIAAAVTLAASARRLCRRGLAAAALVERALRLGDHVSRNAVADEVLGHLYPDTGVGSFYATRKRAPAGRITVRHMITVRHIQWRYPARCSRASMPPRRGSQRRRRRCR